MANAFPSWRGVIHHYRKRINLSTPSARDNPVTLLEGNTALLPAQRLAEALAEAAPKGKRPAFELFIKYEAGNPTGSFKDRGMTGAMTQALADGAKTVICASTGNTAASAAAYAARAGIQCVVLVPDGKIAAGKLAGSIAYGAKVIAINGNFDDGLRMVREATERAPIVLVNNINPARLQGQKTAAFEICDVLGDAPDWLCLPVGNAGNITAYHMGFNEYMQDGLCTKLPRLYGVQAAGSAPLVIGKVVEQPETIATAIRIGNPVRWGEAMIALDESDGHIAAASDAEILAAYRQVSMLEGIFCEPSSATGLAGIRKGIAEGWLDVHNKRIVCVLTGHGLKDPDTAVQDMAKPVMIEANIDALLALLK